MNNEDLQKLKEVALTATPGPWEYREAEGMGAICHAGGWIMDDLSEQTLRDTEYCATANPSAILALIAEVEQARAAKQEPKYGCHIDLPSPEYDACVLDGGNPADCIYAERYGEEGRKKCGEWKPVVFVAPQ